MGWLTSSGCLARAIGPLYITQLYADYGPRITFMVASGLCVCPFCMSLNPQGVDGSRWSSELQAICPASALQSGLGSQREDSKHSCFSLGLIVRNESE